MFSFIKLSQLRSFVTNFVSHSCKFLHHYHDYATLDQCIQIQRRFSKGHIYFEISCNLLPTKLSSECRFKFKVLKVNGTVNTDTQRLNYQSQYFTTPESDCQIIRPGSIMSEINKKFIVGYAKLGTSGCKKCKQKIEKGSLRIGKLSPNPFSEDGGQMKQWFHPTCLFETFVRARASTTKLEDPEDAEGFNDLQEDDKQLIKKLIEDYQTKKGKPSKTEKPVAANNENSLKNSDGKTEKRPASLSLDDSFRQFRRLCANIAEENSYLGKTKLVHDFITKGSSGDGYHGDLSVLIKLLLPGVMKSVYNLNNKQLVKLFSQIFATSLHKMIEDLERGDVAETIRLFFEESKAVVPLQKSDLTLQEVNKFLHELSQLTKEEDQQRILTKVAKRSTANDLKMFVRLIKHDLRINAGAKHILDGLHPDAYAAFQTSHDLEDVIQRVSQLSHVKPGMSTKLSVEASLMTPVLPMLAEACRSVEQAFKKSPDGFFAEIKYDGERVQLHKQGNEFKYYSRSLKPVLAHKVQHFKDFIPKAFPSSNDLILDAEVLLVDNKTGNPLPFGSLNVHKKAKFQDATVCLFVFDCLLINNENLMNKPIKFRRQILEDNMTPVKNHIHLSETKLITVADDLQNLMAKVFNEGLEGLVLKDINSIYEPGKRHWLKIKKDYLHDGSMADSADLVVLGAYYGTGNKGGMMSIFLMGTFDPDKQRWVTVTKCGIGFDDKKLEELNKELDMDKISKDMNLVPQWLELNKPLCPDFVVKDPTKSPVWEIIGAEFSQSELHTAHGISIRFPRVQKFRDDKTWKEATDLPRLKKLFEDSKKKTDLNLMKAIGAKNTITQETTSENDCHLVSQPKSRKRPLEINQENTAENKKTLLNIFHGCKILLPCDTPDYKQLKRYIIAFDGDIVPEFDVKSATHIIGSSKVVRTNETVPVVSTDWLWTCIREKKLVRVDAFKVKEIK